MSHLSVGSNIQTLGEVLALMAPFAGGSIPTETSTEYAEWVQWIQNKQEEYARRAFWRRCLTRETITLLGETTVLPDRFNRPNGLYILEVDGVDWNETPNSDDQHVLIEMVNDPSSEDFGKWQLRFDTEVTESTSAVIWYFSNPPKPVASTDKLLLPGDMVGYAALAEYFRQANQDGSMDKAEQDAENRFQEYLTMEMIPDKGELLTHRAGVTRKDHLTTARAYYASRTNRNSQW
jgi:hypothetical protein